ncbi:MAG: hypothetical protein IT557_03030 [Alphaproteobacteria bacterium]|nr:hypothetical protein [Alphaproteobacteria bacterium]
MIENDPRRIERLTVAAGMSPGASEAMAIGVRLAARLGARLEALFVKEGALARLAGLSVARRLRFPTGEPELIDEAALSAEFAAQERMLRTAIAATAREAGVEWQFQRVPDQSPCEDCELLVLAASTVELRSAGSAFATLAHRAAGVLLLPPRRIARRPHVTGRRPEATAQAATPASLADVVRAVLAEWGLEPRRTEPGARPTGAGAADAPSAPGKLGTLTAKELSELLDSLGEPLLLTR